MRVLTDLNLKIAQLWQQKLSKSQIAQILNVSPNTVIGKVFRWRKEGILIGGKPLRGGRVPPSERITVPVPHLSEPVYVPDHQRSAASLLDRLFDGCAYIVSSHGTTMYCNMTVKCGSYCEEHRALTHVPQQPRKPAPIRSHRFISQTQ